MSAERDISGLSQRELWGSIGGRCAFGTMEWYCCLPAGHEGPHESEPLVARLAGSEAP